MIWIVYVCVGAVLAAILVLFAVILYKVYENAFKRDSKRDADPYYMPDEEGYTKYREETTKFISAALAAPITEEIWIKAFDGVDLYGRYYENVPGAPVMLVFHGYRGHALREGCGGFEMARELGLNVLIPDQRAHGKSGGKCITMGVKERMDCLYWARYADERFGVDMSLVGLSMGAATVMMASDLPLPERVRGIWADCGYSSPVDIITSVAVSRGLPRGFSRLCGCLAARIYGGFSLTGASAVESLKKCKLPILFIHGHRDDFVPCYMSEKCFWACASEDKELFIVENAIHAMSYYVDTEGYVARARAFTKKILGVGNEE